MFVSSPLYQNQENTKIHLWDTFELAALYVSSCGDFIGWSANQLQERLIR